MPAQTSDIIDQPIRSARARSRQRGKTIGHSDGTDLPDSHKLSFPPNMRHGSDSDVQTIAAASPPPTRGFQLRSADRVNAAIQIQPENATKAFNRQQAKHKQVSHRLNGVAPRIATLEHGLEEWQTHRVDYL
jgi:hypothetical protein